MNDVEPMLGRASIASIASPRLEPFKVGPSEIHKVRPLGFLLFCISTGLPSCRNDSSISITFFFPYFTMHFPELVNVPMRVASTSCRSKIFLSVGHFFFGTASVMRSCDSESQICHGASPEYLRGTFAKSTSHPPLSRAISPTAPESPPAPLSVMLEYKPLPRASRIIASESFFCVIGSPICTAVAGEPPPSDSEENVAPWIPSAPTRPQIGRAHV